MGSTRSPSPEPHGQPGPTPSGGEASRADDGTVISGSRSSPPVVATSMEEIGKALQGHSLGPYRLDRFVGGGGMGAVFRAVDTTLDRVVAVKVLSRQQSSDAEMLRRFKNEAQLAARLDHENIGRVHAVGSDAGWHFIVFEFIEGTNLRDTVLAEGPLDVPRALRFTAQVAEALGHAADRGVVHRDIKPSNIIVTPAGRARLVDMGLARLPTAAGAPDLTASGMTLGTFDYISPEQARDPRAADVRSDLYSLGCTLFFMLTGHPPFAEGTLVQKLLQHQQSAPPSVGAERADVPPALERIVGRLLEKRPEDRYQFPAELVSELVAVAEEAGIEIDVERPAGPAPTPPPKAPPRWPWVVPVLLLVLLVAGLFVRPVVRRIRGQEGGEDRRSSRAPGPEAAARRTWRIVDVPSGADELATLAEALVAAADGDVVECAFTGSKDVAPLAFAGKSIVLRAAAGQEPVFRCVSGAADAAVDAAIAIESGRLVIERIGIRVASPPPSRALFAVAPGASLELVSATLEWRRAAPVPVGGRADSAFVRLGPAGPSSAPVRLSLADVQAVGEGTFVVADPGVGLDLRWAGGACLMEGRFLRLDGLPRSVPPATVAVDLRDATFVCRDGFATLLDSPVGPGIPTLRVSAERCRFVVEAGRAFVEQAGIGSPEAYRGAVRWTDRGSRYEGGETFRRIDGAAEREELPFPGSDLPGEASPPVVPGPDP